jgi:hypothetical protein
MDKKTMLEAIINHYTGGNKAQFSKLLGVSPQTISAWVTRNTFDAELIYAKCVGISAEWLLNGNGTMLKDTPKTSPQEVPQAPTAPTDPYIYRLLERKDEENKALIRENGRLEERISNLEAELKEYKKYEDYTYEDFDMYKEMVAEPASTEKSSSHKPRRATYATAHYGSDDMGFEEVK